MIYGYDRRIIGGFGAIYLTIIGAFGLASPFYPLNECLVLGILTIVSTLAPRTTRLNLYEHDLNDLIHLHIDRLQHAHYALHLRSVVDVQKENHGAYGTGTCV